MDQHVRDIASLVGNDTVVFYPPISVLANNASHFITKANMTSFWIAIAVGGVPDVVNQFSHPLIALDDYNLERILGILQVSVLSNK